MSRRRPDARFVSNAVIGGRLLLRACIVNFHTTRDDVEAVPDIVAHLGRRIDRESRASGGNGIAKGGSS